MPDTVSPVVTGVLSSFQFVTQIKAWALAGVLVFHSTGCREEVPPRKSVAELNEELVAKMLFARNEEF